tara:strand:- start:1677 stop:2303 length:627 start_codon:yes stop_codon:yes gene_type:complete
MYQNAELRMKHLLLSLALIISANAWAEDLSFDLFTESFDTKLDCLKALNSNKRKDADIRECKEFKYFNTSKYQVKVIEISSEVNQPPKIEKEEAKKKGLCFGPRGQLEENKAYCSRQEGWVEQDTPTYYYQPERAYVSKVEEPESNFFGELLGAVISGAIEGAIIGAISEPCVPEVKVRTSQTIPGSPQYGTKTRTTVKPCASPYQLK